MLDHSVVEYYLVYKKLSAVFIMKKKQWAKFYNFLAKSLYLNFFIKGK